MALTFDAETHSYFVDGRRVPSVTQRLQSAGLSPDYGGVNPVVLEHARERGIHVEACCQLFSEGTLDEASIHPEAVPYVDAFKRAVRECRIADMRWQVPGYSQDDDTAGTTDIVCRVNGRDAVIDVKCTYKLDRAYRIQLTAYQRQQSCGRYRYVLHLQKRGTYVLLDCDDEERREGADDEATWKAVVALARWREAGSPGGLRETGGSQRATAERTA
jgi:hypothetical protein